MDVDAADHLWKAALAHIEKIEPETLAWARSIGPATFRRLRLKQFLTEYCFVVYASGFRYSVVDAKFPAISKAFKNFQPEYLAGMTKLQPVLAVFANQRKAEAFLKGAKSVIAEGISEFKKRLERDGVSVLEELPGIGPITKDHLAKNIGLLDVAKADVWLERAAASAGLSVQEFVDRLSEHSGESRHVVDVAIWMLGRDGLLSSAMAGPSEETERLQQPSAQGSTPI
jgi:hypothetical protein